MGETPEGGKWENLRPILIEEIERGAEKLEEALYLFWIRNSPWEVRERSFPLLKDAVEGFVREAVPEGDSKTDFYKQVQRKLEDLEKKGLPKRDDREILPYFVIGAETLLRAIRSDIDGERGEGHITAPEKLP